MNIFSLIKKLWKHKVKIKVDDIYEDCGYHVCRCTGVYPEGDTIEGTSLIDGSIRDCSIAHCYYRLLTSEEAEMRIEIWKNFGERGAMSFRGWTEEEIDEFFAKWR